MKTNNLHQAFSALDNEVFSAFCDSFSGVNFTVDFKDNADKYCGVDAQLTATTRTRKMTYDVEIKSVHLNTLLDYCFFEPQKWLSLVEWDNECKLYIAIYINLDKIAIWRVNKDLLNKSEKAIKTMNKNTCKGQNKQEKQVYKLKLSGAKVYDFNLNQYREQFNALYQQATQKK